MRSLASAEAVKGGEERRSIMPTLALLPSAFLSALMWVREAESVVIANGGSATAGQQQGETQETEGDRKQDILTDDGTIRKVYHGAELLREEFYKGDATTAAWVREYTHGKCTEERQYRGHGIEGGVLRKKFSERKLLWEDFTRDGNCEWVADYDEEGTLKEQRRYIENGKRQACTLVYRQDGTVQATYLLNGKGQMLGSFDAQNNMTADHYITQLAQFLDSWEMVQAYITHCFQYEEDPQNRWKTAQQMVQETRKGVVRGDCEDLTFLLCEVLRRRGVPAYAILIWDQQRRKNAEGNIEGHALCLVLAQVDDNHYSAVSLCNFGVERSDRQHERVDAVNALFTKYARSGLEFSLPHDPSSEVEAIGFSPSGGRAQKMIPLRELQVARGSGELRP